IRDKYQKIVNRFDDVENILEFLKKQKVKTAVASRTTEIKGAHELMDLLGWDKLIDYREIFPSEKTAHFANLKKATGIEYKDMLFFDDEMRNSVDVSPLGVTCILVEGGMNTNVFIAGLKKWATNNNIHIEFQPEMNKPLEAITHPFFASNEE
ncbi:hypothetical protein WDU94_001822, partial [Cyamophila willieti]